MFLLVQWFVKWWDKFSHTQDVIDNVTWEFPAVNTIHDKAQIPIYPLVQTTVPQPTANTPATTSIAKSAKSSAKTKKKKSDFDGLSKTTLIAVLKQQWKDEEEAAINADSEKEEEGQNSKASSEAFVANTNP